MGYVGPDETTWQRKTVAEGNHELFNYSWGKYGPYKFWQQPGGVNIWTEEEMLAVDELMRRVCDVDRMHWRFTTFKDDDHSCHYSADPPHAQGPFYQSQTFEQFLAYIELRFIEGSLRTLLGGGKSVTCAWCPVVFRDADDNFVMTRVELLRHAEAEHPEEIAAVRAKRLEQLEGLRDYYRRRDTNYHAELDGPREPRAFIL